jgi:GTP cyclohydrolase FolE2
MLSNIIQLKEVGVRNISFMAKLAKRVKLSIQLLLHQP